MGYTNKQIDPPKIYCSICMCRRRATKTLATTMYAQMQSHQNFCCDFCTMQSHQNLHCDWNKKLMCKCEDKTSKMTLKHNLLHFSSLLLHCLFISIITIYSAITHTRLISLTDTLLSYSFVYSTLLQAMHPQVYKPIVYLVDSLART